MIKVGRALLVNNGSSYSDTLIDICQRHGYDVDEVAWGCLSGVKENYDLVILSGGHEIPVENHEKQFSREMDLVRSFDGAIIGICLGFEIIAKTFGGTLYDGRAKAHGDKKVRKAIDDPIFDGVDEIVGYESHRWKVTSVGDDLLPLAKSTDGIEVLRHRNRMIYGFQFHPERSDSNDCGVRLLENIFTMIRLSREMGEIAVE